MAAPGRTTVAPRPAHRDAQPLRSVVREDRTVAERYVEQRGHLALQSLALEPRLARRLPAELARRFHALPLAEDRGRITVAMADPSDPAAREAITAALGSTACVVRCDAEAIDSLLSQIWGTGARRPLKVVACAVSSPIPPPLAYYAEALSNLLEARLDWLSIEEDPSTLAGRPDAGEHGLYVFSDAAHPLLQHLLSSPVRLEDRTGESGLREAALVVRDPRWPICRILLVLCGEERDRVAVDWVLHLAHKAHSKVTVLAVVPPVPAMFGHRAGIGDGLPGLLTANSPLGQEMRQVARHLVAWEIEAALRLREGPPEVQIRRELAEGNYDLVAVAGRPCGVVRRWLQGDETSDALQWTDRPILITRPAN
jgi:nucleotide-binding universal stress UspA family protein